MTQAKTTKQAVQDMIRRLSPSDAKRVRDVLRVKLPDLLTSEHADLGDHRHDAIPPPEQHGKK